MALGRIKNPALMFTSIIIVLFLAEAIFSLVPSLRQKYSIEKFSTSSIRLERQLNIKPYLYQSSNILGYERIPHSAPEINSYGLIGKDFDIEKKDSIFRILVLGDSLIEYKNYFVECLKGLLKTLDVENNFEIINGGVAAYQAWHYARF